MKKTILLIFLGIVSLTGSAQDNGTVIADEIPKFITQGGESMFQYMQRTILYPEELRADSVEGRVMVKFVVTKKGRLTDVCVHKSDDPRLEEPALQLVHSMKKWRPAKKDGKAIDFPMVLPVQFRLSRDKRVK